MFFPAPGISRPCGFASRRKHRFKFTRGRINCFLGRLFIFSGLGLGLGLIASPWKLRAAASSVPAAVTARLITNSLQMLSLATKPNLAKVPIQFTGIVLCQERDQLIVGDDLGVVAITMDPPAEPLLPAGQIVTVAGTGWIGRSTISGTRLVVDNDGTHSPVFKSGTNYLSKGLNPIRVKWFNGASTFDLGVEWAGPKMARQPIPNRFLVRKVSSLSGTNRLVPGLNYYCYEGFWNQLPDFPRLLNCQQGGATNFDVGVRTRDVNVGVMFEGFIDVPTNGLYTFWTKSDDGSTLSVGPPTLDFNCQGTAEPPPPIPLRLGQLIAKESVNHWAAAEGTVTFVNVRSEETILEITSSTGHAELRLAQQIDRSMQQYLLGCHIEVRGICQAALTRDGQPAFSLWVPGWHQIKVKEIPPAHWGRYPVAAIRSLMETNRQEPRAAPVHIRGTVRTNLPEATVIEDQTGRMLVKTDELPPEVGSEVEVLGQADRMNGQIILANGFLQRSRQKSGDEMPPLPLLTQAAQVKKLTRAAAERGVPVKIKGVITACHGEGL